MIDIVKIAGDHLPIYEEYYKQFDTKGTNKIGVMVAVSFLVQSGLSFDVMESIFSLSDPNGTGYLTKEGFFVALKLIGLAQEGSEISLKNIYNKLSKPPEMDHQQIAITCIADLASPPVVPPLPAALAAPPGFAPIIPPVPVPLVFGSETPIEVTSRVVLPLERCKYEEISNNTGPGRARLLASFKRIHERHLLEEKVAQKEADVRIKSGELRSSKSKLDTMMATWEQLENQKGEAQKRLDDLKIQQVGVDQAIELVACCIDSTREQVNKIREQCQKQEATLKEQEGELDSRRSELQQLRDEGSALEKEYNTKEVDRLTSQLQDTQLEISQVKAMVSQIQEFQPQMTDTLSMFRSAIESNDRIQVSDNALKIAPEIREAKQALEEHSAPPRPMQNLEPATTVQQQPIITTSATSVFSDSTAVRESNRSLTGVSESSATVPVPVISAEPPTPPTMLADSTVQRGTIPSSLHSAASTPLPAVDSPTGSTSRIPLPTPRKVMPASSTSDRQFKQGGQRRAGPAGSSVSTKITRNVRR